MATASPSTASAPTATAVDVRRGGGRVGLAATVGESECFWPVAAVPKAQRRVVDGGSAVTSRPLNELDEGGWSAEVMARL
ncbi:hypothetical protein ACFL5O_02240 [Myxococcota bacterium]